PAIRAALRKEWPIAAERFGVEGSPLAQKYLGDIAALTGDNDAAMRRYLHALELEADPQILGWLLDHAAAHPAVRAHFERPHAAALARATLEEGLRATPLRAILWQRSATLFELGGNPAEAERCAARAAPLWQSEARSQRAVGRVLAAAVYHFVGKAKGLV